jgi:hypothetical protein
LREYRDRKGIIDYQAVAFMAFAAGCSSGKKLNDRRQGSEKSWELETKCGGRKNDTERS